MGGEFHFFWPTLYFPSPDTSIYRDLELASCSNISDAGFVMLSKHCHDLERMDLEVGCHEENYNNM